MTRIFIYDKLRGGTKKKPTLQPVFENRYVFLYHNLTIKV